MEIVNYYDTNTVTEDIDITMKILQNGNKNNRVIYAADVIAYTESVLDIKGLIRQRFRWKWGRCQTFIKNKNLFFTKDKKTSKLLSFFYLPFAIFCDFSFFWEPFMVFYILFVSIYYKDPITLLSAFTVITLYIIVNIIAENTINPKEKLKLLAIAPSMYFYFYVLSFVEYIALIKALVNIKNLKTSIGKNICDWQHVKRPSISVTN